MNQSKSLDFKPEKICQTITIDKKNYRYSAGKTSKVRGKSPSASYLAFQTLIVDLLTCESVINMSTIYFKCFTFNPKWWANRLNGGQSLGQSLGCAGQRVKLIHWRRFAPRANIIAIVSLPKTFQIALLQLCFACH